MNFLNLPNWNITTSTESEDAYLVEARPLSLPSCCPHCASCLFVKHGTDIQRIHDLPSQGKHVLIRVKRQRFRCKSCRKTFFEPLPDLDEKRLATMRLIRYIERKSLSTRRTFISVAEEVGLDSRTVRNIFHDYVALLDQTVVFETPSIMGIDELYVLGHARAVITNLVDKTIIEVLPDRKKQTIIHYLTRLPNNITIKFVCIDMWKSYKEAIQQVLPKSQIVVDKFHITRMANQALESLRKQVSSSLTEMQRKTLKMHDRFLLLRRAHDLTPEEQFVLESWTENMPLLGQAYTLKEGFYKIWDAPTKQEAYTRYFAWMESIPPELHATFLPILTAVENWGDGIFAYFDTHITGGFVEAANGVARVLNCMGRGYSFEVLRARLLYSHDTPQRQNGKRDDVDGHRKGMPISTLLPSEPSVRKGDRNTTETS